MGKVASAQLHHGNVQGDPYIYSEYLLGIPPFKGLQQGGWKNSFFVPLKGA